MPVDDAKNEDQQGVSDSHDAGVDHETDPGTAAPTDHDPEETTSDDSPTAGQAQATETQQDRIVQAIKDIQLLISQASIAGYKAVLVAAYRPRSLGPLAHSTLERVQSLLEASPLEIALQPLGAEAAAELVRGHLGTEGSVTMQAADAIVARVAEMLDLG